MRLPRTLFAATVVLVFSVGAVAHASTVTPSARVNDFVTVRSAPSGSASAVGQLAVGEQATLLTSVAGWHKVQLTNGDIGFVPKGWTQVITAADAAADAAAVGTPDPAGTAGHFYAGEPHSTRADSQFTVLTNLAYSVGYSESHKDPVWVAYRIFAKPGAKAPKQRPPWHTDTRTQAPQVTTDCYTKTKDHGRLLDRGHNAPNFAISTRFGTDAQRETFLMSNVCPQYACLNEQPWQGFEKAEAGYANSFGTIWTVTGPIFDSSPAHLSCGADVPTAFYKIVVDAEPHQPPAMLAIIMKQTDRGATRHLDEFVTTVNDIEARTGLDFFSQLDDATENAAEAAQPDSRWNLHQKLVPDHPCRDTGA